MTKSRKQRNAGFWTTMRRRTVETMTAHRKTPAEIADALGCTTEMVVDFLLGQVGTEHPPAYCPYCPEGARTRYPADDRLFYMAAMAGGRGVAMAAGYHVTVNPKDDPKAKEYVETHEAKVESERVRNYIAPMLPEGHEARVSEYYEARDPAWPTFDQGRLREPANVPQDAPKEGV